MSLSLFEQVVEAIRERYLAIRALDETSLPLLANVPGAKPGAFKEQHWGTGRLFARSEHKTPPFVAWVRGGGTIEEPANGSICDGESQDVDNALYTAEQVVSCVICGTSEAEAEQIWFAILRATRETLGSAAGPQEFRFTTQEEEQAAHINAGREVILQLFDWPFAIPAEIQRRTVVTQITHSDELHAADGATHTSEAHPEPEED